MDELVKLVSKKTGLSEKMAKVAVDTIVKFIKDKLPAPIAGQVDQALGGAGSLGADDITKGLGGLLGKK